jgi:hypothetical protein
MKSFFFLGVFISLVLIESCGNKATTAKQGQCDSMAITKAFLQRTLQPAFSGSADYKTLRKFFPTLNYVPSDIITAAEGRKGHLAYLQSAVPITDPVNGDVIHYLNVEAKDLKVLWDNGKDGGARLYFSLEGTPPSLSIILVPVDAHGENVLEDAAHNSTVVNKLGPCPDNCIGGTYSRPNSDKDLNYEDNPTLHGRWYKPNLRSGGTKNHWWNQDNSAVKE